MMYEESTNEDYEAAIAELLELLGQIPTTNVTMLNMPRYMQAMVSIDKIVKFVKDDCPDAQITVEFDGLTGTCLCLRIVADELNIYKVSDFCHAIEAANTMDVVPRLDEKLEIGFTYKQVKVAVPPNKEN